ncbi:MAG TPA: hypothetical protein VLH56_11835 [Dissulfurispiraceae bacterium]|nr:hypothetical protein [Dissulfurispiraceae bacterium]
MRTFRGYWHDVTAASYRIVSISTPGLVWNQAAGVLSASVPFADSVRLCHPSGLRDTVTNGFIFALPAALPPGRYDVLVYNTLTPTTTTAIYIGLPVTILGSGEAVLGDVPSSVAATLVY